MMSDQKTPFERLPPTPYNHFALYFFAAVYHLIYYLRRSGKEDIEAIVDRYPFLGGYIGEIGGYLPGEVSWSDGINWWRRHILQWEAQLEKHPPLLSLSGMGYRQRLALIIVGLVEEDSRFGTVLAQLQAPLPQRRPGVELAAQLLGETQQEVQTSPWQTCRPLLAAGLVSAINPDDPRSEWALRVAPALWDIVRGDGLQENISWCSYHEQSALPAIGSLILPPDFLARLERVPALLQGGTSSTVIIRGAPGSERLATLGGLARALGMNLVEVPQPQTMNETARRQLGPICAMTRSLPVLCYELGPGETEDIPPIPGYGGPVGIILGQEGGLRGGGVDKAVTLSLPLGEARLRQRLWQDALGGHPVTDLEVISRRFHLPGGLIRQAAGLAVAEARLADQEAVGLEAVRRACRALNRQMLDTLAARVEADGSWEHLVVSGPASLKLQELEQRCRHREQLLDRLGPAFGSSANRGVRALFSGGSGTGKTMAARILANELGMDLYRVDLAAVVNKYIGETEKNLHRVLSTAEALDVILLLDEGDALLGSRTEVRSANDRYANLETNYLLQRLESYQGIVLITSNAAENIDSAFQRRLDVVVNFVPPGPEARWQIWQCHLPADHGVSATFLEEVAVRCEMTGGQIRNAALHAILLALDEGCPTVADRHVKLAVESEYRKAGAHYPLNGQQRQNGRAGNVQAFLNVMS